VTERVTVDTSRISMGEAIAALSALLLFVFLFIDWFGAFNAWEVFDVVDILLTLAALLVFAVVTARALGAVVRLPAHPARVITWAGVIGFVLVLAFLFELDEREIGIYLGLLAAIGIIVGGVMASGELSGVGTTAAAAGGPPPPRDASTAPTVADTDPRPPQPSPPEPRDRPGPPGERPLPPDA
jgi:hypothetical protein